MGKSNFFRKAIGIDTGPQLLKTAKNDEMSFTDKAKVFLDPNSAIIPETKTKSQEAAWLAKQKKKSKERKMKKGGKTKMAKGGMLKGKGEQMSKGPRDKGTPTPVRRKEYAAGMKKGGKTVRKMAKGGSTSKKRACCRGMGAATRGGSYGK